MQTLAELKEENAKEEAANLEAPQAEEEALTEEAAETEEQETEEIAESQEGESEKVDVEAWQQSEDEAESDDSNDEKLFTSRDVASAKRKLKVRLSDQKDENETLKKRIEELEARGVNVKPDGKPRREDFFDAEDPDEAFADALVDYKLNYRATTEQHKAQAVAAKRSLDLAVDSHYERAAKLIEKTNISEDAYRNADHKVRSAIEAAFPGKGDAYADHLISVMGDSSDKIMYHLGINSGKLSQLSDLLKSDPAGLKAAKYIGVIEGVVNSKPSTVSRAPAPPTIKEGDAAATNANMIAKKLQEKYSKAHKVGNGQAAYNARKEAKAAGIDTSNW